MKLTKTGLYRSINNPETEELVLEVSPPLDDGFHLVTIKSGSFSEELDNLQWSERVSDLSLVFVRDLTEEEKQIDNDLTFF